MREALAEAQKASKQAEVPVGAVVALAGKVIGRGFNQRVSSKDPTAHAEQLAIRAAAQTLGDWRLEGAELYVTMEPCLMCFGAAVTSRISKIIFGCQNSKNPDFLREVHANWPQAPAVEGGVLVDDCAKLLSEFFPKPSS